MTTRAREIGFSAAYNRHLGDVTAYVLRRCERDDAGDIVSETFVTAWRRWSDVPPEPETRPWLIGVARNLLQNDRRRRRRKNRLERAVSEHLSPLIHQIHVETAVTERSLLEAALDTLSYDDRELVLATAWDGLSTAEMAIVLGISDQAARQRLHRARQRLAALLAEPPPTPDQGSPR